jgi:hypothetical protein
MVWLSSACALVGRYSYCVELSQAVVRLEHSTDHIACSTRVVGSMKLPACGLCRCYYVLLVKWQLAANIRCGSGCVAESTCPWAGSSNFGRGRLFLVRSLQGSQLVDAFTAWPHDVLCQHVQVMLMGCCRHAGGYRVWTVAACVLAVSEHRGQHGAFVERSQLWGCPANPKKM